ncbi:GNAT family N-acetyltransferase [Herbaspirillum sp. NPDC087042]|uniref:GNAT family N-acetyltransferase n=1 Tax=Herbaspirillum sp. NPDC087042 TaxID=3364004 RepID=UPI0037F14CD5
MQSTWRPMREEDLDEVMAVAAIVHAGFFEHREVFAERLSLYPQGCWIAQEERAAAVLGYAFLHPARLGQPPALDSLLHEIDAQADCLYLHDVALLPAARGAGLGRVLLQRLLALMQVEGLARAALVAVHGSAPYWRSCGFEALPEVPAALREKLRSYDEQALYMIRPA